MLPMDLSFLLYISSVQDYTAGGMLTLFRHYLQSWFDDASMYAFSCPFDPVCTDSGGACSGCVQTELAARHSTMDCPALTCMAATRVVTGRGILQGILGWVARRRMMSSWSV